MEAALDKKETAGMAELAVAEATEAAAATDLAVPIAE